MILFTGDLCLGNSKISFTEKCLEEINQANLIVSNLESVFKNKNLSCRSDKSMALTFERENLENYAKAVKKPLLLTLGNNHIHDLGVEGLQQTKELLSKYDQIQFHGADRYEKVVEPLIIEDEGKKIAILVLSTASLEVNAIAATEKEAGVLALEDPKIVDIIRQAKQKADFCIVIPHWGLEHIRYPAQELRERAYSWIDAGCDGVIGHHPHIIQGKEKYQGKWIYYSLGNYIFPGFINNFGIICGWNKINCYSIGLKVNFKEELAIEELGFFFMLKQNMLKVSKLALEQLEQFSIALETEKTSAQKYYFLRQKNLYQILTKNYSKWSFIKRHLSKKHYKDGRIKYLLQVLIRKGSELCLKKKR